MRALFEKVTITILTSILIVIYTIGFIAINCVMVLLLYYLNEVPIINGIIIVSVITIISGLLSMSIAVSLIYNKQKNKYTDDTD